MNSYSNKELPKCPFCQGYSLTFEDMGGFSTGCMNFNGSSRKKTGATKYCNAEFIAYGYGTAEESEKAWQGLVVDEDKIWLAEYGIQVDDYHALISRIYQKTEENEIKEWVQGVFKKHDVEYLLEKYHESDYNAELMEK